MVCSQCGEDKREDDFYQRSPGVLRKDCKTCVRRRTASQPSRVSARQAAAERKANRIPFDPVAYKAQWYQKNKETQGARNAKWRSEHPEEMRSYRLKWQRANPANGRDTTMRHLARKRGNDARIVTAKDFASLLRRYEGLCAYCRERPFEHWDHIFPVARGGRHAIGNLVPACRPCNQSKSDSLVVEWRARQPV